jgi:hypothetical protein
LHYQSHAIVKLAIHLPNRQNVYFKACDNIKNILSKIENKKTTLTSWFDLNKIDKEASKFFYYEIPEHYTYCSKSHTWKKRKYHTKIIGRMYMVDPKDEEKYCLRLLLLYAKGAQSFDDIRTFNSITYTTFKEAAKARNLLNEDYIWENCVEEAISLKMPKQLRNMFLSLCGWSDLKNISSLFQRYKSYFIEDLLLKYDEKTAENIFLNELNDYFQFFDKKCADYGLPTPLPINNSKIYEIYDIQKEKEEGEKMFNLLNDDQLSCANRILSMVDDSCNSNKKLFFVDGPGIHFASKALYLFFFILVYN